MYHNRPYWGVHVVAHSTHEVTRNEMLIINFEIEIFQLVEARKKKRCSYRASTHILVYPNTIGERTRSLTLHIANAFFAHTIRIMITSYAYRLTGRRTYA